MSCAPSLERKFFGQRDVLYNPDETRTDGFPLERIRGFSEETALWIKECIDTLNFPLHHLEQIQRANSSKIKFKAPGRRRTYAVFDEGVLYLCDDAIDNHPIDGLVGKKLWRQVVVHELAHIASPFRDGYEWSPEPIPQTEHQQYIEDVAQQFMRTRQFVNPRQKKLAELFDRRMINWTLLREEIWANLVHMRYTDPKKVLTIQEQHKKKQGDMFVPLMSSSATPEGIDVILMELTESDSLATLEDRIARYRDLFE